MAGRLVVNTLNTDTVGAVLTTQNGITGIPKAWVNFAGADGTRNSSFNVSSVTRSATGTYTVNFTTAMADANYAVGGFARNSGGTGRQIVCQTSASTAYSTTQLGVIVGDSGGLNDVTSVSIIVCGS